jgi:hypothetical protein
MFFNNCIQIAEHNNRQIDGLIIQIDEIESVFKSRISQAPLNEKIDLPQSETYRNDLISHNLSF